MIKLTEISKQTYQKKVDTALDWLRQKSKLEDEEVLDPKDNGYKKGFKTIHQFFAFEGKLQSHMISAMIQGALHYNVGKYTSPFKAGGASHLQYTDDYEIMIHGSLKIEKNGKCRFSWSRLKRIK